MQEKHNIFQTFGKMKMVFPNIWKIIPNLWKKTKDRKKRNALSVSATRTVNKHNVKIVVCFD